MEGEQQEIIQKIVNHLEKRKDNKNFFVNKNISILSQDFQMMSQMKTIEIENEDISDIYNMMQEELEQYGYQQFKFLGSGAQGCVALAKNHQNKMRHAIKGIKIKDSKGKIFKNKKDNCDNEIKILQKCGDSPFTVKLLNVIEGNQLTYLVLAECKGTLSDLLKEQGGKLSELSAIKYAKDISEGLCYIHTKGYIIQDLKPDNILIDYNNNAVIADLGCGNQIKIDASYGLNSFMGNYQYSAPEVIDPKSFDIYAQKYTDLKIQTSFMPSKRSDAFSLGYLIYSLIFGEDKLNKVIEKHIPLQFYTEIDSYTYKRVLVNIIKGLTQFEPRSRISIQDAYLIMKGIVSHELNLENKFNEVLICNPLKISQIFQNQFEIIQYSENSYFPIASDENGFVQQNKNIGQAFQQIQDPETKRYIIWIDSNDSEQNKQILATFQNKYKVSVTTKYYSSVDRFKSDFQQFANQYLIFILSCQVANNDMPADGCLFKWLKYQWKLDKVKTKIKGIIIYTSEIDLKNIKNKFLKDKQNLISCVTNKIEVTISTVDKIITPNKIFRLTDMEQISFYFTDKMKKNLLQMCLDKRDNKKLIQYHPDKINLQKILSDFKQLAQIHNLYQFSQFFDQFDNILQYLQEIFRQNTDERQIVNELIGLYTREGVPFHRLINLSLNIMNENLLEVLFPVIEMFFSAIYFYDDSLYHGTLKIDQEIILFRGITIPKAQYDNLCKINKLFYIPSFFTFTPRQDVAIAFMRMDIFPDADTKCLIFKHTLKIRGDQFQMRPKLISNHSYTHSDQEYITYPFTCYKIDQIAQKQYQGLDYVEVSII